MSGEGVKLCCSASITCLNFSIHYVLNDDSTTYDESERLTFTIPPHPSSRPRNHHFGYSPRLSNSTPLIVELMDDLRFLERCILMPTWVGWSIAVK